MHSSWFNLQNSFNPFLGNDQSSRPLHKINQNSISMPFLAKFPPFLKEQQSRGFLNVNPINDQTYEQFNNYIKHQQDINNNREESTSQKVEVKIQEMTPNDQQESQQSQENLQDLVNKKGLKSLARLLISTLNKKKFDSSKYLTEEIEDVLLKQKKLSKNQQAKQSKNIRRRTYDALNVMIAANVLGPDLAFIKRVNANSFTKKCALVVGQKKQLQNKIIEVSEKIVQKNKFLKHLQHKKSVLQWWIDRKKQEEKKKQQKNILQKKFKKCRKMQPQHRINFPIIFSMSQNDSLNIKDFKLNQDKVLLSFDNQDFKLFSQIDFMEILKQNIQKTQNQKIQNELKIQQFQDLNYDQRPIIQNQQLWSTKQIAIMDSGNQF